MFDGSAVEVGELEFVRLVKSESFNFVCIGDVMIKLGDGVVELALD